MFHISGLSAAVGCAIAAFSSPTADTEPKLEQRRAVRYVAIRTTTSMDKLPDVLPKTWKAVFDWLKQRHVEPAGPPLIRYLTIDMPKSLDIEVGVPVSKSIKGSGQIRPGLLPAGRYVVVTHTGPYDGMVKANGDLQNWAKTQGIAFQMRETKQGSAWTGRAEFYERDPGNESDPQKYETEILYLATSGSTGKEKR